MAAPEAQPLPVEPARPAPPAAVDPAFARYAGLKPEALRAELGAPGFVRRDRGVEIWQYRGAGCTLHLFLYQEGAEGLRVAHAEARTAAGALIADESAARACAQAVQAQRAVG